MPFLDWTRWALQPWGKSSSLLSGTVSIGNPHFSTLLSPSRDSEGWWACMAASHQPWQVRSQGLWAGVSKTKEETFGRSQGEETSHNCSHLSLLWGCWQGSVGEHFKWKGAKSMGNPTNETEGAACNNILHSSTLYKCRGEGWTSYYKKEEKPYLRVSRTAVSCSTLNTSWF